MGKNHQLINPQPGHQLIGQQLIDQQLIDQQLKNNLLEKRKKCLISKIRMYKGLPKKCSLLLDQKSPQPPAEAIIKTDKEETKISFPREYPLEEKIALEK